MPWASSEQLCHLLRDDVAQPGAQRTRPAFGPSLDTIYTSSWIHPSKVFSISNIPHIVLNTLLKLDNFLTGWKHCFAHPCTFALPSLLQTPVSVKSSVCSWFSRFGHLPSFLKQAPCSSQSESFTVQGLPLGRCRPAMSTDCPAFHCPESQPRICRGACHGLLGFCLGGCRAPVGPGPGSGSSSLLSITGEDALTQRPAGLLGTADPHRCGSGSGTACQQGARKALLTTHSWRGRGTGGVGWAAA